jgi:hypothetical protein
MSLSRDEMRTLFHKTVIVRKPTYGIVKGYHELPYVCLGAAEAGGRGTLEVRGKIQVSPQFVLRPQHYQPSYEEIFGEDNVDLEISGRIFGFLGFPRRPVECKSEHLEVKELEVGVDEALSRSLDELDRREDITTGVIITPDCRYYPVSIERFITSVLDDEFSC